jgi:hypothetical protein
MGLLTNSSIGQKIGTGLGVYAPTNMVDPGTNKQFEDQVNSQYTQARNNRVNAGTNAQDLGNLDAADQRKKLASGLAGIRQGASSRGLLYSGLREGDEATAHADTAASIAQNRAGINRQVEDSTYGQELGSLNSLNSLRQAEIQRAQMMYDQAIANYQQQQAAGSGLFGAFGRTGGSLKSAGVF